MKLTNEELDRLEGAVEIGVVVRCPTCGQRVKATDRVARGGYPRFTDYVGLDAERAKQLQDVIGTLKLAYDACNQDHGPVDRIAETFVAWHDALDAVLKEANRADA